MKLGQLVSGLEGAAAEQTVTGFAIDHRKIAPGTVFGAFQGAAFNGEDFIDEAVAAGAIAIVARREAGVSGAVHVADDVPRRAFANLAAKFFQPFPQNIAAVTGTNGKTSTAELTRQLWRMAGHNAASIGTLGITTASDQAKTGLTTPDIVTFLSNMSGLAREGISHAIFEASSHGLSQYRSEGVPVSVAAFTNLSRDHLDYHCTMEGYFEAKMRLFDEVVETGGSDSRLELGDIAEMMLRRGMGHAGLPGAGAQRQCRQPVPRQNGASRPDQGRAQIAVMISLFVHAISITAYLDSVKISVYSNLVTV